MAPILDKGLLNSYLQLKQPDNKVQCMYVWIDGSLRNVRNKTRTVASTPHVASDLPRWEFCGSATELDVGDIADVYAQPVTLYNDPFRRGNNKFVLCETYTRDGIPTFANNRQRLLSVKNKTTRKDIELEIQQPFTLQCPSGRALCLNGPMDISLSGNGLFCGKAIAESHYRACIYAGVNIKSLEAIDNTGKWKYSVGSDDPVTLGDDLWMSRLILNRVSEDFGIVASFDRVGESSTLILSGEFSAMKDPIGLSDALTSKLLTRNSPKLSKEHKMFFSGISPDSDPYSNMTKVFEALSCS